MKMGWFTVAFLGSMPLAGSAGAESANLPGLAQLASQGAHVSAVVVDLADGKVIASLNSERRLTPASVTKLVLGAAALETLGSEHTFKTQIFATGTRQGSVLDGDLVVVGQGDPYLTNEKLWFLATDVARAGIREVRGDLILDTSAFGDIPKDSNRRAGQNQSSHAYDSPLSAVAVNFSVMALVASPGARVGEKGFLALEPYALPTVKVTGTVQTVKGEGPSKVSASRSRESSGDELRASGSISFEDFPQRVYRSVSDADEYAGSVLRAFLENSGVKVRGHSVVSRKPVSGKLRPVAEVDGFPLDWQLRGLMKVSNNFIGDMLTIALDTRSGRGATLAGGAVRLEEYVKKARRESPWKDSEPSALHLDSGSGLTPENKLAALDIAAVLRQIYLNSREFPALLSALPIPGVEGTVKRRFSDVTQVHLRDAIRAKTGTLTEPFDAVGFAGYHRGAKGRWSAFALLVNGTRNRPSVGVERIRETMDSDLALLFPKIENSLE